MALPKSRRDQLLDPAHAEFAAHGFAAASLNRILAGAGMSKGQAYYYISDKADLYGAVLERAYQRLIEELGFPYQRPTDADHFWQQVEAIFARVGAVLMLNDDLTALAVRIYESDATRAIVQKLPLRTAFETLLRHGQGVQAIRCDLPDDMLADMLFAMVIEIDRWFAANWTTLQPSDYLTLNQRIIAMFRATASPPKNED